MTMTTITNFRKRAFEYISNAIRYNDAVHITTKEGNAVVLNEEEYNGMVATLELMRQPGVAQAILQAKDAPDSEYVPMEDVPW
ncbi:MAG: type II toxin-antitoxin system Phd/YefM family antitoxin [Clostridia bacterium]|nr:type II toxin-antitoxin system Phd/YefM family antitoxin [Clostridia bacterium]